MATAILAMSSPMAHPRKAAYAIASIPPPYASFPLISSRARATASTASCSILRRRNKKMSRRFPIARWAPIPLRLIVGYGFMAHGFAKLSKGPDAFADILQAIGVPASHLMAWSTILVELLGGLAALLGAFVALVSLPMAAVLPAGLRNQPPISRLPRGASLGWLWTTGDRWPYQKAEGTRSFMMSESFQIAGDDNLRRCGRV